MCQEGPRECPIIVPQRHDADIQYSVPGRKMVLANTISSRAPQQAQAPEEAQCRAEKEFESISMAEVVHQILSDQKKEDSREHTSVDSSVEDLHGSSIRCQYVLQTV